MPQMAPISWLVLFIIFSMTFILFNMMNYYIFLYNANVNKNLSMKTYTPFIWKW